MVKLPMKPGLAQSLMYPTSSVLDALHMHIFLKAKGRNLTQRQGNVSFLGTELIPKHIVYLMWNDNV